MQTAYNHLKKLDSEKEMKVKANIPAAFSTHEPMREHCAKRFCK